MLISYEIYFQYLLLECKLNEGKKVSLLCSLMCPQHLEMYVTHGRLYNNWLNK